MKKLFLSLTFATFLAACAGPYAELPIYTATVTDVQKSMRKEFRGDAGGALLGAAAGGALGNQFGKGKGNKAATAVGALLGASTGAAMAGTEYMVPYSVVTYRDPQSGQLRRSAVDGMWEKGMAIRYSVKRNGEILLR